MRAAICNSPLAFIFIGVTITAGCDTAPVSSDEQRRVSSNATVDARRLSKSAEKSNMRTGLATLRRATARYHDVEAAIEDGFVQILPCVENPDGPGALGVPFARTDRFDATIDLSKPEVLFYEPRKNGNLRLIGAEPVVPIPLWTESDPPTRFGREFHRNEDHGLYGLHMWVWRHNTDGMFAFWHPDVSCTFAD